jgi:exodeoxyribonuclease V alpha subunit
MGIEAIHQLEPGCRRLDRAFAQFMLGFADSELEDSERLRLQGILQRLSAAQAEGHSCIFLAGEEIKLIERSGLVAQGKLKALILEQNRLYMQRYWGYEQQLAKRLADFAGAESFDLPKRAIIDRYFQPLIDEIDWQRQAAEKALSQKLAIITGGPGTGKTTTVVKILALLQESHSTGLNIALAAPTGKAAMRLEASVIAQKQYLPCSEKIRKAIPDKVVTLHHLLGSLPPTPYFRHNAENPLPHDVVVVDEVSMVDLALMSKLVDALKPSARLVLLGDKEQLSSVEAGAVLADLTEALPYYTQELLKSHRFQGDIKTLAETIKAGQANAAWNCLQASVAVHRLTADLLNQWVEQKYQDYWQLVGQKTDLLAVFSAFNRFQLLCANRFGALSVDDMNRRIEQQGLRRLGINQMQTWYPGRAVMVVENNARMQLFNGDIGLCLPDSEAGGRLMVFFVRPDGSVKKVMPARLPQCQTCYAMTIHKSQGSEFDEVLIVLPEQINPVLSRELLYTGVTRAKREVYVCADEGIFKETVKRRVNRVGGLAWKLRNEVSAEKDQ